MRLYNDEASFILAVYDCHHHDNDDSIYIPSRIFKYFQKCVFIETVFVSLPTATHIKVKPLQPNFASGIGSDAREILEDVISKQYPVILFHDIIQVKDWSLMIVGIYPENSVKTFNCDPTIEFMLSDEEIKDEIEQDKVKSREDYIAWLDKTTTNPSLWVKEPRLYFDWP
jgi:hypothetical protein